MSCYSHLQRAQAEKAKQLEESVNQAKEALEKLGYKVTVYVRKGEGFIQLCSTEKTEEKK